MVAPSGQAFLKSHPKAVYECQPDNVDYAGLAGTPRQIVDKMRHRVPNMRRETELDRNRL
jgi:hypothetical protein